MIEELILVVLILLNVFELFNLLPGDVEFLKSILSIVGLAYVLYKASFSDIFFGEKNTLIDIGLIGCYLLLIFNKIVEVAITSYEESDFLGEFLKLIIVNSAFLEKLTFAIGIIGLAAIAYYVARNVTIKEPSILEAVNGKNLHGTFKRFATIFTVIIAFYLLFFNLIMEWFTIVMDTPLVVLALFFYMFKIHDIGKTMDEEEFLFKISEFSENFVEKFVELFHSKNTIFLGMSGLLVLHSLNDLTAFMLPYTMGYESVYHQSLGLGHMNLLDLFNLDKSVVTHLFGQVLLLLGYLINTIGFVFLMAFPGFVWYVMYISNKKEENRLEFPTIILAMFFFLAVFLILVPVFKVEGIAIGSEKTKNIFGVDIKSQSILSSGNSLGLVFFLAICIFVLVMIFSQFPHFKHIFFVVMSMSCVIFFGIYLYHYFSSILFFYIELFISFLAQLKVAVALWDIGSLLSIVFLGFMYAEFLTIQIIFYIGGYMSFVLALFKKD